MPILSSKSVLIDAIRQGVKDGEFGLGYISDGSLKCVKFGEGVTPVLDDTEIIIRKEICAAQRAREEAVESAVTATEPAPISGQASIISSAPQTVEQESAAEQRAAPTDSVIRGVSLRLKVPLGGLPALLQMLQALNNKFQKVELVVQIHAADGEMTKQEYEDIVEENIQQGMIEEL